MRLSHLERPVVFIVLDHIHEIASQRFQEVGRVHLRLDLQLGAQAGEQQELWINTWNSHVYWNIKLVSFYLAA